MYVMMLGLRPLETSSSAIWHQIEKKDTTWGLVLLCTGKVRVATKKTGRKQKVASAWLKCSWNYQPVVQVCKIMQAPLVAVFLTHILCNKK